MSLQCNFDPSKIFGSFAQHLFIFCVFFLFVRLVTLPWLLLFLLIVIIQIGLGNSYIQIDLAKRKICFTLSVGNWPYCRSMLEFGWSSTLASLESLLNEMHCAYIFYSRKHVSISFYLVCDTPFVTVYWIAVVILCPQAYILFYVFSKDKISFLFIGELVSLIWSSLFTSLARLLRFQAFVMRGTNNAIAWSGLELNFIFSPETSVTELCRMDSLPLRLLPDIIVSCS